MVVHRFDLHYGSYIAFCQRAGGTQVTRYGKQPCGMRLNSRADLEWIEVGFSLRIYPRLLATEEGMP